MDWKLYPLLLGRKRKVREPFLHLLFLKCLLTQKDQCAKVQYLGVTFSEFSKALPMSTQSNPKHRMCESIILEKRRDPTTYQCLLYFPLKSVVTVPSSSFVSPGKYRNNKMLWEDKPCLFSLYIPESHSCVK